jgi:hypothetical protein
MSALPASADFGVDIPALAFAARVRRDLLAESVEILIAEAAPLLGAIRLADDEATVAQFRRVDLAFRTAKACALEIRDTIGGALNEQPEELNTGAGDGVPHER